MLLASKNLGSGWRGAYSNLRRIFAHSLQARICGLNTIVHAVGISIKLFSQLLDVAEIQEELNALVQTYEHRGHFEGVVSLLEAGLSSERACVGIFTELSVLLGKYRPAKREPRGPFLRGLCSP